jgi:hypothetical protein
MGDYKRWRVEQEVDPSTPMFEEWVSSALRSIAVDVQSSINIHSLLLYMKPSQKAVQYTKKKVFGNHFRNEDETSSWMQMYNSGITSLFDLPIEDARDLLVNYVGVLKDMMLNFCNKTMMGSILEKKKHILCAIGMKSNAMRHISLRMTKPRLPNSHFVVINYAAVIGERYENGDYI